MATTTHRQALPVGYRLQNYHLQDVLGVGGFGVTYLAVHATLGHRAAIKEYLPNEIAVREEAMVFPKSDVNKQDFEWGLTRFLDEAQTLARFDHRNLVHVRDYFEANGTAYIVMDYEDGESLDTLLGAHGTLSESQLKRVLQPVLAGLEQVHATGYLHRDIKPSNVYVRRSDESSVLIDFGAARLALGQKSKSLTAVASAGYSPPEQYESEGEQGPWTDIYALSAVCYRAITGHMPIDAPRRQSRMLRGDGDPLPKLSDVAPEGYSRGLLRAVDWGLELIELERPQHLRAWASAFEMAAPSETPAALEYEVSPTARESGDRSSREGSRQQGSAGRRLAIVVTLIACLAFLVSLSDGPRDGPHELDPTEHRLAAVTTTNPSKSSPPLVDGSGAGLGPRTSGYDYRTDPLFAGLSDAEIEERLPREIEAVMAKHPDLEQIAQDPEFQAWVQTSAIRVAVSRSWRSDVVIEMLDEWKAEQDRRSALDNGQERQGAKAAGDQQADQFAGESRPLDPLRLGRGNGARTVHDIRTQYGDEVAEFTDQEIAEFVYAEYYSDMRPQDFVEQFFAQPELPAPAMAPEAGRGEEGVEDVKAGAKGLVGSEVVVESAFKAGGADRTLEAGGPRSHFTRGSHSDDVLRIQGTPTDIRRYPASGKETWSYGLSDVTISTATGEVEDWRNRERNLRVRLEPGRKVTAGQYFTRGSHKDDVLRLQGTPTETSRYPASRKEKWSYGLSDVTISMATGEVEGWSNRERNLRVRLAPGPGVTAAHYFTRGSYKDDVLRLQGTPTEISRYPASGKERWSYGLSDVTISMATGEVEEWSNRERNLKVRLQPAN